MHAVTSSVPATDSCREKCLPRDPSHPQDLEDLIEDEEPKQNWKGIIISVVVIVVVLGLVIMAIVLVTPNSENDKETGRLSLDEFLQGKYTARRIEPVLAGDGNTFTYIDAHGNILELNCATNTSYVFIGNSTLRGVDSAAYKISADRQYALFPHDVKQLSEHRRLSKYRLLDMNTREHVEIAGPRGARFQYITWSPVGHGIVVVQQNDIFYKQDVGDTDRDFLQVTTNGDSDRIYNGVPDWLYAEEILKSDNAIWMSPDGAFLLYAIFNDTTVDQYLYTVFGDSDQQYPGIQSQRYPKAGRANPTVELYIMNINTNTTQSISPPNSLKHREYYMLGASWRDGDTVLITWLNRPQNVSIITVCQVRGHISCYENYRAEAINSWIEHTGGVQWSRDGDEYFTIMPLVDDSGSYRHIARIGAVRELKPRQFAGEVTWLTSGRMAVVELLGYDEPNQTIYFLGELEDNGPMYRHVYRVSTTKGDNPFRVPQCVSCPLEPACTYLSAVCSASSVYCTVTCEGPGVPYTALYFMPSFKHVVTLETNMGLSRRSLQQSLPVVEYHKIPTTDNHHVWLKLLLPPVLDKEEVIIRYKAIITLPREPGHGGVTGKFAIGWEHVLSSSRDVILVYMDTKRRASKKSIYKRLGEDDVDDILAAVGFLKSLKYVSERISIYGTEYGGYLSAAALGRDRGGLDCAISLSPITDFRYMDSVYAERYMGLPTAEDNLYNYEKASLFENAEKLKNKRLLVIHGTANDRVHFQHSAQFLKALSAVGADYTSQVYADAGDVIRDVEVRGHVYAVMERFLSQCFDEQAAHEPIAETAEYDYYDD